MAPHRYRPSRLQLGLPEGVFALDKGVFALETLLRNRAHAAARNDGHRYPYGPQVSFGRGVCVRVARGVFKGYLCKRARAAARNDGHRYARGLQASFGRCVCVLARDVFKGYLRKRARAAARNDGHRYARGLQAGAGDARRRRRTSLNGRRTVRRRADVLDAAVVDVETAKRECRGRVQDGARQRDDRWAAGPDAAAVLPGVKLDQGAEGGRAPGRCRRKLHYVALAVDQHPDGRRRVVGGQGRQSRCWARANDEVGEKHVGGAAVPYHHNALAQCLCTHPAHFSAAAPEQPAGERGRLVHLAVRSQGDAGGAEHAPHRRLIGLERRQR